MVLLHGYRAQPVVVWLHPLGVVGALKVVADVVTGPLQFAPSGSTAELLRQRTSRAGSDLLEVGNGLGDAEVAVEYEVDGGLLERCGVSSLFPGYGGLLEAPQVVVMVQPGRRSAIDQRGGGAA